MYSDQCLLSFGVKTQFPKKKKNPVLHKHMHTQAHIVISYIYITVT